ncbi:hypothetical protein LCGC14_1543860 [marine sediment metagenome]|uniref:Uncharacterized protein n=1 Tax=marine sediment metagenome TaxID=412755 RepID=A0A0F9JD64_9ZZZZ
MNEISYTTLSFNSFLTLLIFPVKLLLNNIHTLFIILIFETKKILMNIFIDGLGINQFSHNKYFKFFQDIYYNKIE